MARPYIPGDTIRVAATFTSYAGTPVVPATVMARVRNPLGTVVATYVFGDGTLTAAASGAYAFTHVVDRSGEWFFRVESLGSNLAAEEFSVHVKPSTF